MLFKKLSELGILYVAQLHEESKPYIEKVIDSNKRFAKRIREAAVENISKKLSEKKKNDDTE